MASSGTRLRQAWSDSWPALALALAIVLAWELGARAAGNPNFPPLSRVFLALANNGPEIAMEIGHTLRRAAIAFSLAVLSMVPLGILIGRVRWLGDYAEPLIDLLRPLPPPAVVPVVMLFAGTGDGAKVFVMAYAAAFPILIHAIDGVRGLHPMVGTVSRACRLTRAERMWLVDLPAALPVMATGIRLAVAATLLVSVIAEMLLSTDGIGIYILRSQEHFRIADGFAGILALAAVGWFVNAAVQWLDRRLLAWHYATTGAASEAA